MMVSSFWFARDKERPWVKCKESLFAQVVFKQCTPSSFATPKILDDNQNKPIENEFRMNHLKIKLKFIINYIT